MSSHLSPSHPEYDAACDPRVDAWHDGYLRAAPRPADATLAAEWDAGRAEALRDSKRRVALPVRPEGYYHVRPEGR